MSSQTDVMRLCCELSANKKLKAAVINSMKGAAATGSVAMAGGLAGGPVGGAVGAALGGALGWWMTSGQFKSLPEIIMELPPAYQEKLYSDVMAVLGNLKWSAFPQLISEVTGNTLMQEQVLAAIVAYATKELGAKIEYGD